MLTVLATSRVALRPDALALLLAWQQERALPCPAAQEDAQAVRRRVTLRLRKGGRHEPCE